ncbi:MAG: winged helix-turn-helix transcriptional regulator [Succinimonas sp.]|nr:winged helix-turn-helix transcriptional regulator [Succinimonas sp.]
MNNLTSAQLKIIEIIKSDASISVSSVAEQSGIPKRTVEFNVIKLKELEILARKGGAKNGYWEVKV